MTEKKNINWKTAVALSLVIVLAIAAGVGGAMWFEKGSITKTAVVKTASTATSADEKKESEADKAAEKAATGDSYTGWLIYENKTTGYTAKYPPSWTFEEHKTTDSGEIADYVSFYNDDKDYLFVLGMRKTGSTAALSERTGLGVGAAESAGTVTVIGQSVDKTYFVEEGGLVTIIFYGKGLAGKTTAGGYEIAAELGVPGYKDKSLRGSPQETIADKIIGSIEIKK